MRTHPRSAELEAFDHRELPDEEGGRVADHLDGCPGCRERLGRIREIRALAAEATAPRLPEVWPRIRERVEGGEVVLLPSPDGGEVEAGPRGRRTVGRHSRDRGPRRAAVAALALLLLTAAGAVAGTVGPLRSWVRALVGGDEPAAAPAAPATGLDVAVPEEGLTVELLGAGEGLSLRVGTAEGELAEIAALEEAASARFRSGPARVVVRGAADGTLEVRVPPGAARVRVVADGVTLLEVRDGRVIPRGGVPVREVEARLGDLMEGSS